MTLDLVFKGGGAKGVAYIGALYAMLNRGHKFGRCVGTSAGAITAALLDHGYAPNEIEAMTQEVDHSGHSKLAGFLDGSKAMFLYDIVERFGANSGAAATAWLLEKLGPKTFAQWGPSLTIAATDVKDKELLVLNSITAPQMPVYMAVRSSMSIPAVFFPVMWQAAWGTYRGRDKAGNRMVDGGVLSNAPLRLLTATDIDTLEMMGPLAADPNPAVCLYLDDHESTHMGTFSEFMGSVLSTMQTAMDTSELREYSDRVCMLDTCGIGTLQFSVPQDLLKTANDRSFAAMTAHLVGRGL